MCQIWIDSIFYRYRYFAKLPCRYRYRYFPKSPYRYRYFWNCLIDIDIDIDIFKNDHIDIDIDIDIFQKCRYIDNRYVISIYRTGLSGTHLSSEQDQFQPGGTGKEALEVWDDAKVKTTYQNISLKAVIKQTHCVNVVVKLLSAVTVNINKLFSVKVTSIEP